MTFAILPFIVCILVLFILWLIVEFCLRVFYSPPRVTDPWPYAVPFVRLLFGILFILCILHGLGVVRMPVTIQ